MNTVRWTRKALKQLNSIDRRYVLAIQNKVNQLEMFPDINLDLKKIKGVTDTQYRLRVADYRILFNVLNGEPIIIQIETVQRRTSTTY